MQEISFSIFQGLPSDTDQRKEVPEKSRKRFLAYLLLIPFFAIAGALILYNLSSVLARVNNDVRLAKEIRMEKE